MFILIYQFYGQRDARTIEAAAVAVSALCRVCLWPKIAFRSEVTGSGVQTGQRHYSVYTTLAVVSMDWLSTVTDCVPTCIALVRHTRAVNIMSV